MARKIAFIPTSSDGGSATLNLDEIPADVIEEIEEVYKALKGNDGRMRAEFDSEAELATYRTQVLSYCAQRTIDGKPAPLRFRKSPTKNLPATTMDYRITDPPADKPAADAAATPAETPAATPANAKPKPGKK